MPTGGGGISHGGLRDFHQKLPGVFNFKTSCGARTVTLTADIRGNENLAVQRVDTFNAEGPLGGLRKFRSSQNSLEVAAILAFEEA